MLKNHVGLDLHLWKCLVRLGISRQKTPQQSHGNVDDEHVKYGSEGIVNNEMTIDDPQWENEGGWRADVNVDEHVEVDHVIPFSQNQPRAEQFLGAGRKNGSRETFSISTLRGLLRALLRVIWARRTCRK